MSAKTRILSADVPPGRFWVAGGDGKSSHLELRDPSNEEQNHLLCNVGEWFDFEGGGGTSYRARLEECVVMRFGAPDPRLLDAIGLGSHFQAAFASFWAEQIRTPPLTTGTEILVAIFGSIDRHRP